MRFRFVGLVAVLAVAFVAAPACSSSSSDDTATGGDAGSGSDARRADSGGPIGDDASAGDAPADCPAAAPTKADIDLPDGAPDWNPPLPVQRTACSPADITAFQNNFTGSSTFDDLVKGLPTACAQCILSRQSDANWQFIVTDSTGTKGFFNFGACYALAPHGSNECGKAVQYEQFCLNVSCHACPTAQFEDCTHAKATETACQASFGQDVTTACAPNATVAQELDRACGSAANAVAVLCGNGLPDGGMLPD